MPLVALLLNVPFNIQCLEGHLAGVLFERLTSSRKETARDVSISVRIKPTGEVFEENLGCTTRARADLENVHVRVSVADLGSHARQLLQVARHAEGVDIEAVQLVILNHGL